MSTTLIVRDAILAINGAPEKTGDPRGHLSDRMREVGRMSPGTTEECLEVLLSAATGKDIDPEIVEALLIVGLAHPHLAARKGFVPVAMGRRLAARLERTGDAEHAIAILETLAAAHPDDAALERDLAALLRRHGMVQDLGDRYYERALELVREGRNAEAVGWLREVLQLDRGRKDAARLIRDLRLRENRGRRHFHVDFGPILWTVLTVVLLGALGWREFDLHERYRALPEGVKDNLAAQEERLAALEEFTAAYPVWHGAILAVKERTELRFEVRELRELAEQARAVAEEARSREVEGAEVARQRALERFSANDLEGALENFRAALEQADDDWTWREQVQREIEAITEYLESGE